MWAFIRFMKAIKGIEDVEIKDNHIKVQYQEGVITPEEIRKAVSETVNVMGYSIIE